LAPAWVDRQAKNLSHRETISLYRKEHIGDGRQAASAGRPALSSAAGRVLVFIQWGFEYLTFSRGARLITGTAATDSLAKPETMGNTGDGR